MSPEEKAKLRSVMEGWLAKRDPRELTHEGCILFLVGYRKHACDLFNMHDSTRFVAVEVKDMDSVLLVPNELAEKFLVLGAPA